ncbi:hypothetical protein A0256_21650 [Mucilaginibacter sp. PAMC 26640]|nr:hypothetical protein A0256_21650 [Mucilaginibacter sp. PAMC 26640]
MQALFSPIATFIFFLLIGSLIVYFILKFDKLQRNKMKSILSKTRDVKPLLMTKAVSQKLRTIKPELNHESRSDISKQLDELVEAFDKGQVTLPEYCSRLNRLLTMVA